MRHDSLDRWSRLDSPVHRLPAGVKLLGAVGVLLFCVLWPALRWGGWLGVTLFLLGVAGASRVPAGFLLRRVALLEPFALGVALLALFQPGGGWLFLALMVRATLCLLTITLLTSTTPFAAILEVLRRIRVPALLVTTLALLYRYLFVLVDEAERMQRAAAGRTFRLRRGQRWRLLAGMAGQLFVRSTERAERIYAAMCARGWKT
jgi:cobalt/nickel transport system permease protein